MLLRNMVLQTCPPDRPIVQYEAYDAVSTPGYQQHANTSHHSTPMNISSCIQLLLFEECLSKMAACVSSSQRSECYTSLPEHLQTLARNRDKCLLIIYRAAADMELIKSGDYAGAGDQSEGYKAFANFTCGKGWLVAVGVTSCDVDQQRDAVKAMKTRMEFMTISGDRPSPDELINLCRELMSAEGLFTGKCRADRQKNIPEAKDVKKKLTDLCHKECEEFLNLKDCISRVHSKDSTAKYCSHYSQILKDCVAKVRCEELRESLFLAILPSSFKEKLYEEGCVPRPGDISCSLSRPVN
ncbi:hypothetical protein C0Q70_08178 [Pomacea canaliculata]|uniref:Uncharacterized protein n=1 Tax=Pomacea canaliculata TaxID=400727 RepID=A0A2T7PH27_POMCA|nr:hypothetical protein C0Q70_08178 [Pomacea canaliculata]